MVKGLRRDKSHVSENKALNHKSEDLANKTSKISDIFEPFKNNDGDTVVPSVILVDGAPGMGKSTLCKEIAYLWATDQLLEDFQLVLLINLRNPKIQQIMNIESLIHYFYNFDPAGAKTSQLCATFLLQNKESNVLLILDGFDECSSLSEDSLIFRILERDVLMNCKLIITSRPIASQELRRVADIRVELLGFEDESKVEYIRNEFKNKPRKIQQLCSYLKKNSSITSICYIPVVMTILICIFKETKDLPDNQAALYEKFITVVVSRYIAKLADKQHSTILRFESLSTPYKEYLYNLSKFAFESLKTDLIVFSKEDIKCVCPDLVLDSNDIHGLGLLNTVSFFSFSQHEKCIYYNFLHLSIQEYLAAHYFNTLTPSVQFDMLKMSYFVNSYTNIWILFFDLCKLIQHKCFEYSVYYKTCCEAAERCLTQKINELCDKTGQHMIQGNDNNNNALDLFQCFLKLLDCHNSDDCDHYSHLLCFKNSPFLHCGSTNFEFNEFLCYEYEDITIDQDLLYFSLQQRDNNQLLELFIIDNNIGEALYGEIATRLFQSQKYSIVIVNHFTLLSCRVNEQQFREALSMKSCIKNLVFTECCINEQTTDVLSSCPTTVYQTLEHIMFSKCNLKSTALVNLSELFKSLSNLQSLFLLDIYINEEIELNLLLSAISNIDKLEYLHLNFQNCICSNNAQEIASTLKTFSTLESLCLTNIIVSKGPANELAAAFHRNQSLKYLRMPDNSIGGDEMIVIAEALCNLSLLKIVDVSHNPITSKAASALASVISNNKNLEELNLENTGINTGLLEIVKALQNISSLQILNLGHNDFPDDIGIELAAAIESNSSLRKLWLTKTNLRSSAVEVFTSLSFISCLTTLCIEDNVIDESASDVFAIVLSNNFGLEELYLGNNCMGVSVLNHAHFLTVVDLSNNNLSTDESDELANLIQQNTNLEVLVLKNNNLESSVTVVLDSLTRYTESLKVLDIENNAIDETAGEALADLIKNTELRELYIGNNNFGIGLLNVVKALQNISTLNALDLSENGFSDVVGIELVKVIQSNHLQKLILRNTNLKSSAAEILKALSSISSLYALDLVNIQLNEEASEALESVILNNSSLEELRLENGNITIRVVKGLSTLLSLTVLDLGDNNLSDEMGMELAKNFQSNCALEELHLGNNNFKDSILNILQSLAHVSKLKVINFENIALSEEACDRLVSVLLNNTKLEELYLQNTNLRIKAVDVLNALKTTSLNTLDLSCNNLPQDVNIALSDVIRTNRLLQKLFLSGNNLSDGDASNAFKRQAGDIIACTNSQINRPLSTDRDKIVKGFLTVVKALQNLSSLEVLDLTDSVLSNEVCTELAVAIQSNQSLVELHLGSNKVNSSLVVLLQSLSTFSSLKVLSIQNADITEHCCDALASVIENNSGLEVFCLPNAKLHGGILKIIKALQNLSTLLVLDMNDIYLPPNESIELATVIYSNEFLEELKLRNNNLIFSATKILKALCNVCSLHVLDLVNTQLTKEACETLESVILNNIGLKELYLGHNNITMNIIKALSTISSLTVLDLDDDSLSDEIGMELAKSFQLNYTPEELHLGNNNFKESILNILQSLDKVSNLKVINFDNITFSEEACDGLVSVLLNNTKLEELYLQNTNLGIKAVDVLNALKTTSLNTLDLSYSNLPPDVTIALSDVIELNSSLDVLILGGVSIDANKSLIIYFNEVILHKSCLYPNSLNSKGSSYNSIMLEILYQELFKKQTCRYIKCLSFDHVSHLKEDFSVTVKVPYYFNIINSIPLKSQQVSQKVEEIDTKSVVSCSVFKTVKVIDLENNNIDEDASFELATALHSNNVLEQLWLRGNKLNTAGALYILNSLEYLTTLQVLDMSYNKIGSQSADGIAAVIDNNPLINQLWLDGNDLHNTGTITICNALKKIRTLSILSLCNNGISDDAADELSAVITQNVLLEDLLLSNNQLHSTGIKIIAESLSKLIKLRKLDLFNNNIGKEGASSLAIFIQNSTSLQDLFLSGNNLETSGALEICNALSHIDSLHVLTLSNNNISDEVTSQLIEVLNNNHLYALLIGGNGLECGGLKIAQVIENDNIAMQLLDYSNNNISEQDKEKIKEVFSKRANFKLYM